MPKYVDTDKPVRRLKKLKQNVIRYLNTADTEEDAKCFLTILNEIAAMLTLIDETQTADVAEVKRGKWLVCDYVEPRRYGCSRCHRLTYQTENYCPKCGARMVEGEEYGEVH